jgi:hypothetical protein
MQPFSLFGVYIKGVVSNRGNKVVKATWGRVGKPLPGWLTALYPIGR